MADAQVLTHRLRDALESLDRPRIEELFRLAVGRQAPLQVIENLIVPALVEIGEAWADGRVALSQVYMSSRICEELVARLLPPSVPVRKGQLRQAIAVLGDYHLLGKRIVLSVLRASGFDILDYGRMEADELVDRALADDLQILLISVLMLPSALKVREVRAAFEERRRPIRIGVGGAPFLFDDGLWREVGADAMGRNAADGIAMVRRWAGEVSS